jgi:hypothetical protein
MATKESSPYPHDWMFGLPAFTAVLEGEPQTPQDGL